MFTESNFWKNLIIGVILGVFFGFIAFFVSFYGFGATNLFGLVDPLVADYGGFLVIIASFISIATFFLTILIYFYLKRVKEEKFS